MKKAFAEFCECGHDQAQHGPEERNGRNVAHAGQCFAQGCRCSKYTWERFAEQLEPSFLQAVLDNLDDRPRPLNEIWSAIFEEGFQVSDHPVSMALQTLAKDGLVATENDGWRLGENKSK